MPACSGQVHAILGCARRRVGVADGTPARIALVAALRTASGDARLLPELRELFRGWEEAVAQPAILECRRFAMIADMSTVGHQAGFRVSSGRRRASWRALVSNLRAARRRRVRRWHATSRCLIS